MSELLIFLAGFVLVLAWVALLRWHRARIARQDHLIRVRRRWDAWTEEERWQATVALAGELFEDWEPGAWSSHDA